MLFILLYCLSLPPQLALITSLLATCGIDSARFFGDILALNSTCSLYILYCIRHHLYSFGYNTCSPALHTASVHILSLTLPLFLAPDNRYTKTLVCVRERKGNYGQGYQMVEGVVGNEEREEPLWQEGEEMFREEWYSESHYSNQSLCCWKRGWEEQTRNCGEVIEPWQRHIIMGKQGEVVGCSEDSIFIQRVFGMSPTLSSWKVHIKLV